MKTKPQLLVYCTFLFVLLVCTSLLCFSKYGFAFSIPVALFTALIVVGENQDILLGEEPGSVGLSSTDLLLVAMVIALRTEHVLTGPLFVGLISGACFLPHLRDREWHKIVINTSLVSAISVGLAIVVWNLPNELFNSIVGLLVIGLIATFIDVTMGSIVIFPAVALNTDKSVGKVLKELLPTYLQEAPFIGLGVFLGAAYLDFGPLLIVLFIVPLFIGRATYASFINLKNAQDATVRTLISALEAKDPYTAGHAERVAKYAEYVGEEFNFTPGRMERLKFAAQMHDIGKLIVPNHILNKPGRLTESEFEEIKKHEEVSVQMLNKIDFLKPIAPAVMDHNKFSEDESEPIEPYIVAAADAYDAMTSSRSYRKALSQEIAFKELRDKSGTQFHPKVAEALIHAIEKRGEKHGAGYETGVVHEDAPEAGLGSGGLGNLEPDSKSEPPVQNEETNSNNVVEFPKRAAS